MTKDEALTMIIASIAMEELALSHIINAEGEKLQYILGTLPGGQKVCATPQEILAVNKSVTELLDTVMQSQMLLKGKMEKALEAGGYAPEPPCPGKPSCPCKPDRPDKPSCPCKPGHPDEPSCPCKPDHPDEPSCPCKPDRPNQPSCPCKPDCSSEPPCPSEPSCPCKPACPGESPCNRPCGQKSTLQLVSRCHGFSWDGGFLLSWRCQEQRGGGIRWNDDNPALVDLEPGKAYGLDYTINVRGPYCGDSAGAVFVRLTPCDAFSEVLPLYFSVKCLDCEPLTLHYSTTLFPQAHGAPCADLALLLNYGGSLFVEEASLNIVEL